MARHLESGSPLDRLAGAFEGHLEFVEFEIDDCSALGTDEVMMMLGQTFIKFEASETLREFELDQNLGID